MVSSKYYCDHCGKEIIPNEYFEDIIETPIDTISDVALCNSCQYKLHMIIAKFCGLNVYENMRELAIQPYNHVTKEMLEEAREMDKE